MNRNQILLQPRRPWSLQTWTCQDGTHCERLSKLNRHKRRIQESHAMTSHDEKQSRRRSVRNIVLENTITIPPTKHEWQRRQVHRYGCTNVEMQYSRVHRDQNKSSPQPWARFVLSPIFQQIIVTRFSTTKSELKNQLDHRYLYTVKSGILQ